jgi:hypothetical protein
MTGISNCATCVELQAQEARQRMAYDGMLRVFDKLGAELSEQQYSAMRKLADEAWLRLEAASEELERHRRGHREEEAD